MLQTLFLTAIASVSGGAFLPSQTAQTAQAPVARPTVGAKVHDPQGVEVGTIESIRDGNAIIFTGTHRATIPLTSLGTSPKGPTLGMTRAELDVAAAKAEAEAVVQFRARLVPGTEVRGTGGALLGKVKSVEGETVTLSAGKGEARVPIAGMGMNSQGVFLNMTQAEFEAALSSNASAPQ